MKTLILDNKNWQLGTSTDDDSDFSGLAGLSPNRKGQNYYKSKGDSICGQPNITMSTGATLDAVIMCGIIDPTSTSRDAILISESGKYYHLVNEVLTNFTTDSINPTEYNKGKGDIIFFKNWFYVTNDVNICRIGTSLATTFDWWTTTMGKTALSGNGPHPMEVVEDTLYIADINKIHTYDGTTAVYAQFNLPDGYVITALRVHPDGRYLKVFATDTFNYFHSDRATSKLYLLDTTTLEFINEYELEEQVEGVINFGGTCFCTYGKNFGYFDGAGLKLLRKIEMPGSSDGAIWSSSLSLFNNTILFPSATYINAFGDVSGKGNITFYPYSINDVYLHYVLPVSADVCFVMYVTTGGLYRAGIIDFSTAPTLDAQTTKADVGSKIWIRKVDLFIDTLPTGGYIQIYNRNVDGSSKEIGVITRSDDGSVKQKTFYCNVLADFIQPYVAGGNASAVKKIHIQYESAE